MPKLVRGIGHIRTFAVFAAAVSASTLGLTIGIDWMLWGCLRFLMGICMAGLFSVTAEGVELHPSLLRAAAAMPLDAGARFDAEALRGLLSRALPASRVPA